MSRLDPLEGFCFGDFVLSKRGHSLSRGDQAVSLTAKEFSTLMVLVESAGSAVAKQTLMREVWPDTFVSDSSLTRNICVLRKHLGDEAIATVPKYGYRFALPVKSFSSQEQPTGRPMSTPTGPGISTVMLPPAVPPVASRLVPQRRSRRFQMPRSLLTAALLLFAATLFGFYVVSTERRRPNVSPPNAPARLAVLPFRDLSTQANGDYLAQGLAEELITTLGQMDINRVRVLASSSSALYDRTTKPASEISHELNAPYLVQGTIQVVHPDLDAQVVLTVHLVDGKDQAMLWSGRFTRPLSQLRQMQTEIVESIAREIKIKIVPGGSLDAHAIESADPLAHEAYLHGRFELEQKTVPAFRRALERLNAAVELDPRYARAYAAIAEVWINLAGNVPPGPAYAHAKAAALRALELNGNLAEAHRDLGWILFCDEANAPEAEKEYRRALQLNPSDAPAHHWYAQLLMAEHRTREALVESKAGLELDPLSLGSNYNYAFVLIDAGRPGDAVRHLENMLAMEPANEIVYGYLGTAFVAEHDYQRAADTYRRAMELSTLKVQYKAAWAYSLAKAGDTSRARRLVAQLEASSAAGAWIPASNMTLAYVGLGDKDRAFSWLSRCVTDRSCTLLEVNTEPLYSELSSDPRFARITATLYGHNTTRPPATIASGSHRLGFPSQPLTAMSK